MILTKKYKNWILKLDMDLCYQVYKKFNNKLNTSTHNVNITDHALVNKNILCQSNGLVYNIVSVHKQWYGGWYIALLLEREKSHHLLFWKNINCIAPEIVEGIEENNIEYVLVI